MTLPLDAELERLRRREAFRNNVVRDLVARIRELESSLPAEERQALRREGALSVLRSIADLAMEGGDWHAAWARMRDALERVEGEE